KLTDEHVVILMLDEAAAQLGAVEKLERRAQRAIEAHLLAQPAMRRRFRRLARSRMAAGSVGPQARRMILRLRALLQQQSFICVEDEDGERAMERARTMRLQFFADA